MEIKAKECHKEMKSKSRTSTKVGTQLHPNIYMHYKYIYILKKLIYEIFLFQINAVVLNFLFKKES